MNVRKLLIVLHDLSMTGLAVLAAFYIRFEGQGISERHDMLLAFMGPFILFAGFVYYIFSLYESKWRFASLPDLSNIFKAVTVLAVSIAVVDYILVSSAIYGRFFFGKITIGLYWCLQMLLLGGPRLAYRYFRYTRVRRHAVDSSTHPCLVLGRAADAELVLRAIENGAVKKIWPFGILSPSHADQDMVVRNVRILGTFEDVERVVADLARRGTRIGLLIMTSSALAPEHRPEQVVELAHRLGIDVRQLAGLEDASDLGSPALRVTKLAMEDLLLRPAVRVDYAELEQFVKGQSIVVTGGGGSIGLEICRSAISFGADRLLIIENSEPALRAALDRLETLSTAAIIDGRIADVRDRNRMFRLITEFRPDLVFHAAALKHIQLVEREWAEGVRTNVFGSINVADAAAASGAKAMVMISTDKAIEPVSVLGATKRLAEMYCQALDADLAGRAKDRDVIPLHRSPAPTRLVSVRFGNVLASNGSVVPRFRAQIEAGGPVTVTHSDMVRYFMTVREASDLVITSAGHAVKSAVADVSVYVLNMGQPVKILDLAERMIRLLGHEPGKDIEIVFTGLREGERLNEILFAENEPVADIGIPGIVAARPRSPALTEVRDWIRALEKALDVDDRKAVVRLFQQALPDFKGAAA